MHSRDQLDRCKRQLTAGRAFAVVMLMSLFVVLVVGRAASDWDLPDDCKTKENPQSVTEESLKAGKEVYDQNCLFCHGEGGAGDGQVASMLPTKPPSFADAEHMDKEADGEFFCKISIGRDPMPGFAKKLSADQIWHTINYLRQFPKQKEQ